MSRKFDKLPSISNVSAGSTATLEIPLGATYDRITLEHTGVTLAQIQNIEVSVNGKPIQQYKTATLLSQLNKFWKRGTKAGFLDFYFVRPEFDNQALRRLTAIGTADVQTFSIKFDIDAAATAPVITAYAVKSPQSPLGMITKIKNYPASAATAGQKDIDNIPKEGRLAAVHFYGKADISNIVVEADSARIYERSKALGEKEQESTVHGRLPLGADGTSVDFISEGNPDTAFAATRVRDLRFRPTLDTAGAFDVVVEYLTGFEGI